MTEHSGTEAGAPERTHPDMWVDPSEDPREAIAPGHGERGVVLEYLDRYRTTFEMKCEDLTPAQLAARSVPPSPMSLLGLVRHLAQVEHAWSRRLQRREPDDPRPFKRADDPDWDFHGAEGTTACVEEAWAAWRAEVAAARTVERDLDFDAEVPVHGEPVAVRDIMVHLVEEYARHVGHADLLRECVDGRTGQ